MIVISLIWIRFEKGGFQNAGKIEIGYGFRNFFVMDLRLDG